MEYLIRILMLGSFSVAIIFAAAGSLNLWRVWLYYGVWAAAAVTGVLILMRLNPELLVQRAKRHVGTESFDRLLLPLYLATVGIVLPIVAGLDLGRLQLALLPVWTIWIGIPLYWSAMALSNWAMVVNRHFEPTVRIQSDRDHRVIDRGPYAWMRHPGYAAGIWGLLGFPLVLGSAAIYVPALFAAAVLVVRTVLEDRTLREKLPGYRDYALQVRWRLLPGLW